MSQPFLGEIRIWGCDFAPLGWALANGQLLPISQNTALFSILGTNYGGNGTTTFGLPDLRGLVPVGSGTSSFGTQYEVGETGGETTVQLTKQTVPAHTHPFGVNAHPADHAGPSTTAVLARANTNVYYDPGTSTPPMVQLATPMNQLGGGLLHGNEMPYMALNVCIALQGVFPQRP